MSVVDSFRQPEYTGENRCGPCTAVNLLLTAGASAAAWVLLAPWVAAGTFAAGAATIYLRGYLVPGTPALTKRYLPAPVLRAFGKAPLSDRTVRSVGEDAPSERWLVAAGALSGTERGDGDERANAASNGAHTDGQKNVHTTQEEQAVRRSERRITRESVSVDFVHQYQFPALADRFAERWDSALEDVPAGAPSETALRDALGTEDVSKHADTAAVVDGSQSARWLSTAAMRADVAAARVFAATVEGWDDVPPDRRLGLFRDLRLFVETCPDCGGEVELEERTVDPCCERPHTLLEARCSACETSLADEAVVGVDGDVPARIRAIRD